LVNATVRSVANRRIIAWWAANRRASRSPSVASRARRRWLSARPLATAPRYHPTIRASVAPSSVSAPRARAAPACLLAYTLEEGKDWVGWPVSDQPWCAVGDHQQRRAQAPLDQLTEEAGPGVVALVCAWRQADQHRDALAGDPPAGKHRLGRRARVHPRVGAIQEQVLKPHVVEVTMGPGVELVLDRLAVRGLSVRDVEAALGEADLLSSSG
jgi:hypothetical protein